MGFLDKLRQILGGGASSRSSGGTSDPHGLWFHFRCEKCGELVRVRADRRNDLNREDGGPGTFLLRKEIMGSKKCYQLIHAELWLDSNYRVVSADVQGGALARREDYEAAQGGEQ